MSPVQQVEVNRKPERQHRRLATQGEHFPLLQRLLTRSLPRDVYIRRQNDHLGGQGRIYTSHLNFVSTLLSKPGHRRGCCCMSPRSLRCLLRQFVDRCLLFWAFFIEKTVLLCFARFLSKWRETALWLFQDATSWYELYV